MVRYCCVPDCRSNGPGSPPVSTFQFPKNEQLRNKWLHYIWREDLHGKVTKYHVVCIKHFAPQHIIRSDFINTAENGVIELPRRVPKLTDEAFPSLFPDWPPEHSIDLPQCERTPEAHAQAVAADLADKRVALAARREAIQADRILSFEELRTAKVKEFTNFLTFQAENHVLFYLLDDVNFHSLPKIKVAFKISQDFSVKIIQNNEITVPSILQQILGSSLKCEKWSKLKSLTTFMETFESSAVPLVERIKYFSNNVKESLTEHTELDETVVSKLEFLMEQLELTFSNMIRYSPKMLVWAASLFYAYPGAYRTMRDTNCLTLPYPGYLQRLLVKIGNDDPGLGPSQIAFLKEKFKLLEQNQKTVAILLDEIYVASRIVYKGGKIFGLTEESNNPSDITAQTLQAFMYHSVQEKNKDVIALFPVRSITAEILYKLVMPVLKVMEEVGFRVLCLIADDNQVNAKMFKMLGDGTLKPSVPHPFNSEEKLFLLFDQVHLFKNVRNNWINAPAKLFKIPHISLDKGDLALIRVSDVETMEARFSDIIDLFNADKRNIAKLAPKLSRKSVFPSSVERQNVQLVVNVFHDTTIQALETLKKDGKINISDGSIMLLKLLVRWWKISNVKNASKGTRLNDVCCELVRNSGDPNSKDWKLIYLREFKKFLEVWNSLAGDGKLTNQTYTALVHTITATLELVEYVFTKYGFADMLLGKLQTDNVEGRFGGYRRMSGSNYHVSVEQVCESERKLKLLGILRMKSDRGEEFSIKTFGEDCEKEAKELKTEENLEFFKPTIQEKQTVSVSLNNLRVLVCLASYAATKVIQHFSKTKSEICSDCVSMLITTELLEIERAEEIYSYLSGIDRGGLNKPSDFSFNLCVNIFKLFSKLISSKYESQFLKLQSPRRAIVSLGLQMCKNAINDAAPCPNCDLSLEKVIKKILRTLANCFLKNYAKNLQESNTARLLAIQYSKKATKEEKKKQEKTPTEKSCAESEKSVTTSVPVAVATGKFKDPIERKLVKLNPVRLTVTTPKTNEAVQKYACDVNLTADQLITFKNLASNSNAASSNVKLSVPEMLGRIAGQMCEQVSSKNRAIGNKENLGPIKLPNQISDYAGDVTKAMKRTAEDYRDVRSTKVMKVVMKQDVVLKDTSNTAGEKQLKVVRVIPAQQRLALIQNQPTTTTANLQKPPERQALKKSTNTLR